jgi:hypothetical protein
MAAEKHEAADNPADEFVRFAHVVELSQLASKLDSDLVGGLQVEVSQRYGATGRLASLRTRRRVAFMHYAPIVATVAGEPLEIQPFLGSGRLEEPLDRYHVDVTFHGHAHRGSLEGRTRGGCPVYNVALPLLRGKDASPTMLVLDLEALAPAGESPAAATTASGQGGSHAV